MADDTTNDKILKAAVRRAAHRLRFANGLSRRVINLLRGRDPELGRIVLDFATQLQYEPLHTDKAKRIVKRFESEAAAIRQDVWAGAAKLVRDELEQVALDEIKWTRSLIADAIPLMVEFQTPKKPGVISAVMNAPIEGVLLGDWLKRAEQRDVEQIVQRVQTNKTNDISPSETRRQIMGQKKQDYKGSHNGRVATAAQTMIQTSVTHVATAANEEFYHINPHVFEREVFTATLDSRTTPQCANQDGRTYKIGEGPMPPLHFRCRSIRLPYISPELVADRPFNPLSERQAVKEFTRINGLPVRVRRSSLPRGYKGKFDEYARKRKRELIGNKPDNVDFDEYLKGARKDFQVDWLGVQRREIWKKHDLQLKDIVGRDGDFLTLEELDAKGWSL